MPSGIHVALPRQRSHSLQRLLHIGRQVGRLTGDHVPTPRRVDINVNRADLSTNALPLDGKPRGPETRGNGGILKDVDFDVGGSKKFIFYGRRFDGREPLRLVHLLAVGERTGEIIAVNTPEEGPIVQLDGPRGLFFKTNDFLPFHLGASHLGCTDAALNASISPGRIRSLPSSSKRQP